MQKNLVQQLTEELTAATKRAQALQHIVDELFTIAAPGALKNALWARYQSIEGASPAKDFEDIYQPLEGDIYIIEVRRERFTIHRYDGQGWQQLGGGHSEQDAKALVAPMQFLGESKGFRQYYRPTGTQE